MSYEIFDMACEIVKMFDKNHYGFFQIEYGEYGGVSSRGRISIFNVVNKQSIFNIMKILSDEITEDRWAGTAWIQCETKEGIKITAYKKEPEPWKSKNPINEWK